MAQAYFGRIRKNNFGVSWGEIGNDGVKMPPVGAV
jgi:hypothetical protein